MNKAIFLDRDGVITIPEFRDGRSYAVKTMVQFRIYSEVPLSLEMLKKAGYLLVIVSNQPDVGRGIISQEILNEMNSTLLTKLPIDLIKICPHVTSDECLCRKPKPGMLLEAAKALNISLSHSFMVGDRGSDIKAGKDAGCLTVFIDLGYTAEPKPNDQDYTCTSILQAAQWILRKERVNDERASLKH